MSFPVELQREVSLSNPSRAHNLSTASRVPFGRRQGKLTCLTLMAVSLLWISRSASSQSAPFNGLNVKPLSDHVPLYVSSARDEGATPADKQLPDVAILLARTPQQEAALQLLLQE